jgi:hypothetical protein
VLCSCLPDVAKDDGKVSAPKEKDETANRTPPSRALGRLTNEL